MDLSETQAILFDRILSRPLSDPDAPHAFEDRLADENGRTRGHATRVVLEYRRFLLLTQVADHPVTPSREVDAAWHAHLTWTTNYRSMCDELFGQFLDHQPSKGAQELDHYRKLYERTLVSYQEVFGEKPPADLWPPVEVRFGPTGLRSTLASDRSGSPLTYAVIGAVLAVVAGTKLGSTVGSSVTDWSITAYAIGLLISVVWAFLPRKSVSAESLPRVDAYEAAWLAGGPGRVAATATAVLVDGGLLQLSPERNEQRKVTGAKLHRTSLPAMAGSLHPVELALGRLPRGPVQVAEVPAALAGTCNAIEHRLQRARLVRNAEPLKPEWLAGVGGLTLALVAGSYLASAWPSSASFWLVVLLIANVGLLIAAAHRLSSGLTADGWEVVRRERDRLTKARVRLAARGIAPNLALAAVLPLAFALEGSQSVIHDARFAGINFVVPEEGNNQTGSSGGDAGCSSSCGGDGGCGGCGGCGG